LQHTIEKIWTLVHDLLKPEVSPSKASKEARHCILTLLSTLCQSQLEKSGALRAKFFTFIKAHNVPEDILPRFQFLKSLTENGRDVSYFDEKIGPFLLEWMSDRQTSAIPVSEFMSFLVNIIKFNQSFLDDDILMGIIQ
jgi:tuberous sclerosis protein 2